MTVDSDKPRALLSYTRNDDRYLEGGISWLREELEKSVSAHTGYPFRIFQGAEDIQPGDRWANKIDQALEGAQIFIPILTPSFFQSNFCRIEAQAFLNYEINMEWAGFVLPLYLIQAHALEKASLREVDDIAKALHERQYDDWRSVAGKLQHEETRRELTDKITRLAETIARLIERDSSSEKPPPIPKQSTGPHFRINEDGLIDRARDDAPEVIENEARMASLQAGLRAGCDRLLVAGISQNAFGYLIDDIRAYQDAISPAVRKVQSTDVWRLGLVLQDHADAVGRDVDRLGPSLEDDQQAALKSLVGLHGPFILSSDEGRALQALSHENRATRDELTQFQEAADRFV